MFHIVFKEAWVLGYKKIILIVDDKAVNRQILRHFLAEEYEIIEAGDGDEALKILYRRDDISAVLLDLRMPVMDGFQVLESMRSHANMAAVPVLARFLRIMKMKLRLRLFLWGRGILLASHTNHL